MYFYSLNSTTKGKKFPLSCQQTFKLLYFQAEKNDKEGCRPVSPYEVTVTRGTTAVYGETHDRTADILLTGLQPNATHSVTIKPPGRSNSPQRLCVSWGLFSIGGKGQTCPLEKRV